MFRTIDLANETVKVRIPGNDNKRVQKALDLAAQYSETITALTYDDGTVEVKLPSYCIDFVSPDDIRKNEG